MGLDDGWLTDLGNWFQSATADTLFEPVGFVLATDAYALDSLVQMGKNIPQAPGAIYDRAVAYETAINGGDATQVSSGDIALNIVRQVTGVDSTITGVLGYDIATGEDVTGLDRAAHISIGISGVASTAAGVGSLSTFAQSVAQNGLRATVSSAIKASVPATAARAVKNAVAGSQSASEALARVFQLVQATIRKKAGFAAQGRVYIVDSALGANAEEVAAAMRARGLNARSVREIYGADVKDSTIRALADQLDGRVVTADRGRDALQGGGFGDRAIRVDGRIKTVDSTLRSIEGDCHE